MLITVFEVVAVVAKRKENRLSAHDLLKQIKGEVDRA